MVCLIIFPLYWRFFWFLENQIYTGLDEEEYEFLEYNRQKELNKIKEKKFEENKLVHTIDDGTKQLKYALCLEACECEISDLHYHFHCVACLNTFCLTNQNIPKIELPKNFTMQQANMVVKGICESCNQ